MEHKSTKKVKWANGHKLRAVVTIFIACTCGWFVMELEILGVRVLAPYFGSAVYVVTGSVIGVFLLSLSSGYLVGGWISKKVHSKRTLGINLITSGLWLCVMPFFIEPVCNGIFNTGLDEKWGSLLASLILFGVPILLLGTVSPTMVRWLTTRASDSGFSAGLVLAFSTMASFLGCIVTAFYLVLYSVRRTIYVSGFVLVALGVIILLQMYAQNRRRQKTEEKGEKKKLIQKKPTCF